MNKKAIDAFNIYRDLVSEDYNFVNVSVKFDDTGMIITNEIIPRVDIRIGVSYICINAGYETSKTVANRLFSDLEDILENLSFKTFIK